MLKHSMKLLTGAALAAVLHVSHAGAADKVVYQLDWLPGGDKAPIYVCIQNGFCEEEGIEVSIEPGKGSTEAITKMATGTSDIGTAGISALMAAKANEDVPVTAVMSYFNKGPHAFFATKDSGIADVADVKGKEVATSPFTSSNVFLPLVLEDVGLTEDDITLTKADPAALGPMLMTGSADAVIAWLTNVTVFTNQAKEAGKELVVLPWSAAGLDLYEASVMASDRFLTERPDVAKRFLKAYKKSMEFTRDNPEEAAKAVTAMIPEMSSADVAGGIKDAFVLVFNDVTDKDGFGVFEPGRLQATWERVSASQGLEPGALDPESIVDRSYMPES